VLHFILNNDNGVTRFIENRSNMILLKCEEMESWAVFLETKQKVTLKVLDIVVW
jgi:hypothetical protein